MLKTIITFFYCTILFSVSITAQTKITGKITDQDKVALPGANIYIKDTYDGATSDVDGTFSFTTDETGDVVLVVSYVGYKSSETKLTLDGKTKSIDVILEEESTELGTVVISAGSFEASDEKKAVILRPLDIVTTAGAQADIYSALKTLPGTQQIGETEGLFVRGGSASETKTIIDEMIVQNPFFSKVPDIPSRGRFSPFLFKGTVFSTGGYSAQYGEALSSVLVLKTQDLAPKTQTSLSLMILGLGGSHVHRWENTSLAVEANYFNLSPYMNSFKQRIDWKNAPIGINLSTNLRHKTSDTGMLKVFSSYSNGHLSLYNLNLDDLMTKEYFGSKNYNFFLNANYREVFGKDWAFFAGYSFSDDNQKIDLTSDKIVNDEKLNTSKVTVSKQIVDKSFILFGGEILHYNYKNDFDEFSTKLNEDYGAGFVESDIFITNDIAVRVGLRSEYSKLLDKINLAPRISAAYRLGEFDQLNFAYGDFYETPSKEFLLFTKDFDYEKATHYIANYQYLGDNITFRVEVYYKNYADLAKGNDFTYPTFDVPDVTYGSYGRGYAKGIDIFWRDRQTFDLTDYWISYSYLDTKRDYRNYPNLAQPTFATPHTFSIVVKRWVPQIASSIGITYSYATGRPYFNPNNQKFLGDKTKDFQNLSFNISYLTNVFNNFTVVYASLDNLIGYNNIYNYRYSSDGLVRMPIVAPALRSFFIGMFISLGESNPY
jgi:CarboxypepD_reg-like domain